MTNISFIPSSDVFFLRNDFPTTTMTFQSNETNWLQLIFIYSYAVRYDGLPTIHMHDVETLHIHTVTVSVVRCLIEELCFVLFCFALIRVCILFDYFMKKRICGDPNVLRIAYFWCKCNNFDEKENDIVSYIFKSMIVCVCFLFSCLKVSANVNGTFCLEVVRKYRF